MQGLARHKAEALAEGGQRGFSTVVRPFRGDGCIWERAVRRRAWGAEGPQCSAGQLRDWKGLERAGRQGHAPLLERSGLAWGAAGGETQKRMLLDLGEKGSRQGFGASSANSKEEA